MWRAKLSVIVLLLGVVSCASGPVSNYCSIAKPIYPEAVDLESFTLVAEKNGLIVTMTTYSDKMQCESGIIHIGAPAGCVRREMSQELVDQLLLNNETYQRLCK